MNTNRTAIIAMFLVAIFSGCATKRTAQVQPQTPAPQAAQPTELEQLKRRAVTEPEIATQPAPAQAPTIPAAPIQAAAVQAPAAAAESEAVIAERKALQNQETIKIEGFEVYSPQDGEKPSLTPAQMELAIGELLNHKVRDRVLNGGTFEAFAKEYKGQSTRVAQEAVVIKYHKDAASLKPLVTVYNKKDITYLTHEEFMTRTSPRPTDVKEFGTNVDTKMGERVDCENNPFGLVKSREAMLRALVERMNSIPNFDFAHKAAVLREFDRAMKNGPDGYYSWLEPVREHPDYDWTVGGKNPSYNRWYHPDPKNSRAWNAKSLNFFLEEFGEIFDAGCACGGNWGKKTTKFAMLLTLQVNAPVCTLVQPINGTPLAFTSSDKIGEFAADLIGDRSILDGQWTLNNKVIGLGRVNITKEGDEKGTPFVQGQSIIQIPIKGLENGTYTLRYHAVSKDRFKGSGSEPYVVDCFIVFTVKIPPPPPPPSPAICVCNTLSASRSTLGPKDTTVFTADVKNLPKDAKIEWSVNDVVMEGETGTRLTLRGDKFDHLRTDQAVKLSVHFRAYNSAGEKIAECEKSIQLQPIPKIITQTPKPPKEHKSVCGPIAVYCWGPPVVGGIIYAVASNGGKGKTTQEPKQPIGTARPARAPVAAKVSFTFGGR